MIHPCTIEQAWKIVGVHFQSGHRGYGYALFLLCKMANSFIDLTNLCCLRLSKTTQQVCPRCESEVRGSLCTTFPSGQGCILAFRWLKTKPLKIGIFLLYVEEDQHSYVVSGSDHGSVSYRRSSTGSFIYCALRQLAINPFLLDSVRHGCIDLFPYHE